jgi:type IV secretory pathway component VirB8
MTDEERFAEARRLNRAAIRREKRHDFVLLGVAVLALGLMGWMAQSNARLAARAAEREVVFVTLRDDGTLVNSASFSSLPESAKQASAITNTAWGYVVARECYDSGRFATYDYIAQAMSDIRVGREWREYVSLQNKQSPRHVYGDHGIVVQCSFIKFTYDPDGAGVEFAFDRWQEDDHGKTEPVRYVAHMRFLLGVYSDDPRRNWVEKSTFNAPGIQVTEYPGAKPEGIARPKETAQR